MEVIGFEPTQRLNESFTDFLSSPTLTHFLIQIIHTTRNGFEPI